MVGAKPWRRSTSCRFGGLADARMAHCQHEKIKEKDSGVKLQRASNDEGQQNEQARVRESKVPRRALPLTGKTLEQVTLCIVKMKPTATEPLD